MPDNISIKVNNLDAAIRLVTFNFVHQSLNGFTLQAQVASKYEALEESSFEQIEINIGPEVTIKGIIVEVNETLGAWISPDEIGYKLTVLSLEQLLKQDNTSVRYENKQLTDHIEDLLTDSDNYTLGSDLAFSTDRIIQSIVPNPYVYNYMQQDESSLSSLSRICQHYGLTWHYDIRNIQCPIVIVNEPQVYANNENKQINSSYLTNRRNEASLDPCVYSIAKEGSSQAACVNAIGYNPDQAEADIEESIQRGALKDYSQQSNRVANNIAEAQLYASNESSDIQAKSRASKIKGDGFVNVGDVIAITKHDSWYVTGVKVKLHTDGQTSRLVGKCTYEADVIPFDQSINVFNSTEDNLVDTNLREGWRVIPYYSSQLSDDDYTTADELGYYKTQVPEYYRYEQDAQSTTDNITKVKKAHLFHSGDQQHNAPYTAQSTIMLQSLLGTVYSQAVMGSRQTEISPAYTNLGSEQSYRFNDNKHNSLTLAHEGRFLHDTPTDRNNAVVLTSPTYQGGVRSAQLRFGDPTSEDLGAADKGISLYSDGNYYANHPNNYVCLYGQTTHVNPSSQAIVPVHRLATQRYNQDASSSSTNDSDQTGSDADTSGNSALGLIYHWLESYTLNQYQRSHVSHASSFGHTQDETSITRNQSSPLIQLIHTNDLNQEIHLNTKHTTSDGQINTEKHKQFTSTENTPEYRESIKAYQVIKAGGDTLTQNNDHSANVTQVTGNINKNEQNSTWQNQTLGIQSAAVSMAGKSFEHKTTGTNKISANAYNENAKKIHHNGPLHISSDANHNKIQDTPPPKNIIRIYFMDRFFQVKGDASAEPPTDDQIKNSLTSSIIDANYLANLAGSVGYNNGTPGTPIQSQIIPAHKEGPIIELPLYNPGDKLLYDEQYHNTQTVLGLPALNYNNRKFELLITGLNGKVIPDANPVNGKAFSPTIIIDSKAWGEITKTTETLSFPQNPRKLSAEEMIAKNKAENQSLNGQPIVSQPKTHQEQPDIVQSVTVYHVVLSILEPPMLINLRQDYYTSFYIQQLHQYKLKDNYPEINIDPVVSESVAQDGYNQIEKDYSPLMNFYASTIHNSHLETPIEYQKPADPDQVINKNELDYYIKLAKAQQNNLTFFVHGYNSPLGDYPNKLIYPKVELSVKTSNCVTLSDVNPNYFRIKRDKQPIKASMAMYNDETIDYCQKDFNGLGEDLTQMTGEGACRWNLEIEKNLNVAAGFDGSDMTQYGRIIQIAWMGDPELATDYMAAVPMAKFAGEKLADIIAQLKDQDIKINLIAHSLGNEVLMHTIDNLGKQGKKVDHIFMWEAAIPNNSFDLNAMDESPMKHDYLDMIYSERFIPQYGHVTPNEADDFYVTNQDKTETIDLGYTFPDAHSGADKITVLYSKTDNILGALPVPDMFDKSIKDIPGDQVQNELIKRAFYDIGKLLASSAGSSWFDHWIGNRIAGENEQGTTAPELTVLEPKSADPGAGLLFALPSMALYLIDQVTEQGLGQDDQHLQSIYQLANRFVYPLGFFTDRNMVNHCEIFYEQWTGMYGGYKFNNVSYSFNKTLAGQHSDLAEHFKDSPLASPYEIVGKVITMLNNVANGKDSPLFDDIISSLYEHMPWYFDAPAWFVDNTHLYNFKSKLQEILKTPSAQAILKGITDNQDIFFTTIFTAMMTTSAQPKQAMGYSGIEDIKTINQLRGKLFQTFQAMPISSEAEAKGRPILNADGDYLTEDKLKTYTGQMYVSLCIDHSGMLFPSKDMMKWVYEKALFGTDDTAFTFFGNYIMAEVKAKNGGTEIKPASSTDDSSQKTGMKI